MNGADPGAGEPRYRAAPTPARGIRATARLTLPAPVGRSVISNDNVVSYCNESDQRERGGKMRAVARTARGGVPAAMNDRIMAKAVERAKEELISKGNK